MSPTPGKQIRMFEKDWMERLSHIHPLTPLIIWTPIISYLLWKAFWVNALPIPTILSLGLISVFIWTFMEYVLHRWVFHFPEIGPISKKILFMFHGVHHDAPDDSRRLVMAPPISLFFGLVFYSTFKLLVGQTYAEPMFAFFAVGYLCYDYIHYYIHFFTPKTAVGKYLKRYHMVHHYADHEAKWGVSSPFWDYVFGTVEEKEHSKAA